MDFTGKFKTNVLAVVLMGLVSLCNTITVMAAGTIEDFESGTLSGSWTQDLNDNSQWIIDSSTSSEGIYSLRSGDIADNQSVAISFTANFTGEVVTIDIKSDTESCCDRLRIYLDDVEFFTTSGVEDWHTKLLPIPPGNHTLKFVYVKDGSVSTVNDSIWIDNLGYSNFESPWNSPFGFIATSNNNNSTTLKELDRLGNTITELDLGGLCNSIRDVTILKDNRIALYCLVDQNSPSDHFYL